MSRSGSSNQRTWVDQARAQSNRCLGTGQFGTSGATQDSQLRWLARSGAGCRRDATQDPTQRRSWMAPCGTEPSAGCRAFAIEHRFAYPAGEGRRVSHFPLESRPDQQTARAHMTPDAVQAPRLYGIVMRCTCLTNPAAEHSVGHRRSRRPTALRVRRHARFVSSARSRMLGPVVGHRFWDPAKATAPKTRLSDSQDSSWER